MFFTFIILVILSFVFSNNSTSIQAPPEDTVPITAIRPSLNGTWQLDRVNSESVDDILQLMGVSIYKRRIIRNLDIKDIYDITQTTFHIIRDTSHSHKNQTYRFNIEETVNDELMGDVKQIVTYINGNIVINVKQSNNAKACSIRKLSPNDPNKMIFISNYTIADGSVTKTCTRYFKRK